VISRTKISNGLTELGLARSVSSRVTDGAYEPSDADWNYKDIPHLAEVHHAVDGVVIASETNHTSSVFLQKVGLLRIPLVVYIGNGGDSSATYVGSAGPFVIVIETVWDRIGENRTRVTTTYEIFSPKVLRFLQPLVHRLLSRNYDILMTADLPMRDQRGKLRKRGYTFIGDTSGYGFRESSNVFVRNVIAPAELRTSTIRVLLDNLPEGRSLHGGDAEDGLVIERNGSTLTMYPRICDHEGASLDCAIKQEKGLRCPWHGRNVRPVAVADLATRTATSTSSETMAELQDGQLVITRTIQ